MRDTSVHYGYDNTHNGYDYREESHGWHRQRAVSPGLSSGSWSFVLVGCFGCDQATESLARGHLQDRGAVSFLDGTLRLQYAENPDGFLSLGASLPRRWRTAVFTVGTAGLVLAMLSYALFAQADGWERIVPARPNQAADRPEPRSLLKALLHDPNR
jgi:hypothetical protein